MTSTALPFSPYASRACQSKMWLPSKGNLQHPLFCRFVQGQSQIHVLFLPLQVVPHALPAPAQGRSCVRINARKPHDPIVLKAWDYILNKGVNPQDLPRTDDSRQYFFWCDCERHRVLIFLQTLARKGEEALFCRVCRGDSKSDFERKFWKDCDRICNTICPLVWVVEARVLMGRWAAADIYFHDYLLLVQNDGSQHFENEFCSSSERKRKQSQNTRDERWNTIALLRGYNILRINHDDMPYVEFVLMEALGRCGEGATSLMYSPRYPTLWRMASKDVPDGHAVVDLGDL